MITIEEKQVDIADIEPGLALPTDHPAVQPWRRANVIDAHVAEVGNCDYASCGAGEDCVSIAVTFTVPGTDKLGFCTINRTRQTLVRDWPEITTQA